VEMVSDVRNPSFYPPTPFFLFGHLIYSSYICGMKTFGKILFVGTFIFFFYLVGSAVVNSIMALFPVSASEWFPVIKFLLWILTFSINFFLTLIVYFIFIYIISAIASLLM